MYFLRKEYAKPERDTKTKHHEWKTDCIFLERNLRGPNLVVAGDVDIDHAPLIEGSDDAVDEEAADAGDDASYDV